MGLKEYGMFLQEVYVITVLKKRGYSIIDVRGNDGVVNSYFKKIGVEKHITIGKRTYPINDRKRMTKWGMAYYVFTASAFGEDKYGKCTITNIDGDVLQELIRKARLVGQNTTKGDDKKYLFLGLGGLIGVLIGWIIKTMLGA